MTGISKKKGKVTVQEARGATVFARSDLIQYMQTLVTQYLFTWLESVMSHAGTSRDVEECVTFSFTNSLCQCLV